MSNSDDSLKQWAGALLARVSLGTATALGVMLATAPAWSQPEDTAPGDSEPSPTADADSVSEDTAASDESSASSGAEGEGEGESAEASAEDGSSTEEESSGDAEGEASAVAEVEEGGGLFESAGDGGSLFESAGDEDSGGDVAGGGSSGVDLGGYVRSDLFIGKVPGYDRAQIQAGYGELSLKLDVPRQEYGSAFAEMRLRYGQQMHERKLITDLREAYVNAYLGDFDLRLGHQIIVWGRADVVNPTNNLTPVDLRVRSPIEDDRRVANMAARLYWNLSPIRVEGVWVPWYSAVQIPQVQLPDGVVEAAPKYPNRPDLADGTFAGRVHLELSAFEASVSYLHGYSLMPGIDLVGFDTRDNASVTIRRRAYNHDVFGVDFSTTVGDFGVRGEAAYRQPLHHEDRIYAPRPDVQYVLGVDAEFGSLGLIAQYVGRYTLDWQEDSPGVGDVSALRFVDATPTVTGRVVDEVRSRNQILFQQLAEVQHMVSLRAEYKAMYDTLSLSALGFMNVTTGEWLVYPKVQYQFTDSMSGAIGGEVYFGPENTLFDIIEEELSAGYAELRFTF